MKLCCIWLAKASIFDDFGFVLGSILDPLGCPLGTLFNTCDPTVLIFRLFFPGPFVTSLSASLFDRLLNILGVADMPQVLYIAAKS